MYMAPLKGNIYETLLFKFQWKFRLEVDMSTLITLSGTLLKQDEMVWCFLSNISNISETTSPWSFTGEEIFTLSLQVII